MKEKITAFIDGLIPYDYALFGAVFLLFILFIIIALMLRRKVIFSLFFILLAFTTLLAGPTLGYIKLHAYLFKHTLTLTSQKRLEFSKAVIVYAKLTNESKKSFKECKITASAYAHTSNKLKNYLKKFKPFQKASIFEKDIAVSQTRNIRIILEPFNYSRDYNISLGADCK